MRFPSKVQDRKGREYELLPFDSRKVNKEINKLSKAVAKVISNLHMKPGAYLEDWFYNSDFFFILKYKKRVAGFFAYKLITPGNVFISTMMFDNDFQGSGLMNKCTKIIVKDAVFRQMRHSLFSLFRATYIMFRTDNPKLYEILLRKKLSIWPNLHQKFIPKKIVRRAVKVSSLLWPHKELDKSRLVLKEAFKESPELMYRGENIPWSSDDTVNDLFRKNIYQEQEKGNAQLILTRLDWPKTIGLLLIKN